DAARIPHYRSPVRCGRAMATLSWYAEAQRRRLRLKDERAPALTSTTARAMLDGQNGDLHEYAAKRVLAEYGIPVIREELAKSSNEALAIARRMGYPLVLKVQSPDIPHKTEALAVRLGVSSDKDLLTGYSEVLANARAYKADARIDGVLVQEMLSGGAEVILGVVNEPPFGPAVMFGLGGIFAEILKDVAFRLAPITPATAREMVEETVGYPALTGARGMPRADVDA